MPAKRIEEVLQDHISSSCINERHVEEAVELPIDGVLDLHAFLPREVKDLIPAYLSACSAKGIFEVRIIHGKGIGNLRRTVHSILSRLDCVASFRLAGESGGGWGATLVVLQKRME